jgi:DNA-binding transcriptional ArsR family regulator
MKDTEKLLKALANRRRLAILKFLNKTSKASVGQVAREIKLSFKATSKHLGLLRSADVLDREQVNLQMFYSLSRPLSGVVKSVIDVL